MNFFPGNGFVEIRSPVEGEKENQNDSDLYFPQDENRKPDSEYSVVEYIQGTIDTSYWVHANKPLFLVVTSHMIQNFEYKGKSRSFVRAIDIVGYLQ